MHINSKSLSELENSQTEVSLKQFLKKNRFIVEANYGRNVHQLCAFL